MCDPIPDGLVKVGVSGGGFLPSFDRWTEIMARMFLEKGIN